MKKNLLFLIMFVFVTLVSFSQSDKKVTKIKSLTNKFTIYSKVVKDSFYISVQLPEDYDKNAITKYPTTYMVDANFHFPILAATIKQYEKGGLLPPMILVGIGYKSFKLMDSLRLRDYMYPSSIPSDEINAIGGGKNFYEFIANQLIPLIDLRYKTEKSNRSLLGHSFGGYFSLFALLNQTEKNQATFKNFASASPPLWYNNFYINQLTEKLKNRNSKDTLNIFLSAGGLEDSTWTIAPVKKLANNILNAETKTVNVQCKIYGELGHMDNSIITFTKALQAFYKKD